MKTSISWSLVVVMILACTTGLLPQRSTATVSEADRLAVPRAHIQQLVSESQVPSMAVAVAHHGEILWEEGFGWADRGEELQATEQTMYPLASISKPFTATGLMILVEHGLVDLDKPINDYLGEAKIRARVGDVRDATVRRVANHTAGLPLHAQHFYDGEPQQPPPTKETVRRHGYLVTAPGERWQYSNLGYGLLAEVVIQQSGLSYAEFMRQEVFEPLGLNHTAAYTGTVFGENWATEVLADGTPVPASISDTPGASSLYSSAHDLIRFALFHLHHYVPYQTAILSPVAIDEMQHPGPETGPLRLWEQAGSGYGLGWNISVAQSGLCAVHHNGGSPASSALFLVPEEGVAVVVLSNTQGPWTEAIAIEILNALLPGKMPDLAQTVTVQPFRPGPDLVGVWRGAVTTAQSPIPLLVEIEESGSVYATLGQQARMALQRVSYQSRGDIFLNAGGEPFLRGRLPADPTELGRAVMRGSPSTLWLELKLRDARLNGSLVAFSQRTFPTGPLAHWVDLERD